MGLCLEFCRWRQNARHIAEIQQDQLIEILGAGVLRPQFPYYPVERRESIKWQVLVETSACWNICYIREERRCENGDRASRILRHSHSVSSTLLTETEFPIFAFAATRFTEVMGCNGEMSNVKITSCNNLMQAEPNAIEGHLHQARYGVLMQVRHLWQDIRELPLATG